MAVYTYKGLLEGAYTEGEIDADDTNNAIAQLRERKVTITSVKLSRGRPKVKGKDSASSSKGSSFSFSLGSGVTPKEIMMFSKQLSTMVRAGLPLLEAIDILRQNTANPKFGTVLKTISDDLQSGSALSAAFQKHPKVFDSIYINLLKAGEASGRLDTFLNKLVESIEKTEKVKSQIKTAMFYPGIVVTVALSVTVAMLVMVVPTFVEMYGGMGVELPGSTKAIISISEFIRDPLGGGVVFLATIFAGVFGKVLITTNAKFRRLFHKLILKLPFFSDLVRKAILSRFSMILSNLLQAGVGILEALDIGETATNNMVAKEAMQNVKRGVFSGKELSTLFEDEHEVFPVIFNALIKVGERTGTTDEMFGSIAVYYEEELDTSVGRLSSIIEPVMIVFMGILIGGLLMALYAPIFNMGQVVGVS